MNEEKSSFDELVAGITPEERSFLLAKLNESKTDLLPVLQSTRDDYDSPSIDIKIKTESVFYKFFLYYLLLFISASMLRLSTCSRA